MPTGPKVPPPPPPTPKAYVGFHDAYPRSEGPPPIPAGSGPLVLARTKNPTTVVLDEGAFRVVWELVESTAMSRWESRNTMKATAAIVRAVEAFRLANPEGSHRKAIEAAVVPRELPVGATGEQQSLQFELEAAQEIPVPPEQIAIGSFEVALASVAVENPSLHRREPPKARPVKKLGVKRLGPPPSGVGTS
jgi:hypothetical protein